MLDVQKKITWSLFKTIESSMDAEETKFMIEDEQNVQPPRSKTSPTRIHLPVILISMFMFVSGTLMVVSTLNYKQSDRSCAAQLSIWCKLEEPALYTPYSDSPLP